MKLSNTQMSIKNQSHFYYPIMIFIKYTVNNNSRQQITIYIVSQIFEYSEYCKSSTFLSKKTLIKNLRNACWDNKTSRFTVLWNTILRRATNMRNAGCGFVDLILTTFYHLRNTSINILFLDLTYNSFSTNFRFCYIS